MKRPTALKQPAPLDSTRYIDRYLNEMIEYGGYLMTRGEVIADMQSTGTPQGCIDRWLQGQELAARIRARHERLTTQVILAPARQHRS